MALLAIPAIIAVALLAVPLLVKTLDRNAGWPLAITFFAVAGYVMANSRDVINGTPLRWSGVWIRGALPPTTANPRGGDIDVALSMDALSLFFTLLALLIGGIVFIYSTRYLHPGKKIHSFYLLMTTFMLAVLILILADDVALLFIGWELVSLASFFLIARAGSGGEAGATRTLLLTFTGGLFLIAALGIMVSVTGSTRVSAIIANPVWAENHVLTGIVAILIALAGFSKAAQIPFHFWLPEAMAADTPVSAFLHAAAVVKAGIYLLLRFSGMFHDILAWHYTLIIVGMTTAVMAAIYAMQKTDLKKLTAYSTVSQLGWIIATIGVGTPFAIAAALVHTAAHALFKSSLFMLVGVVDHQAGSRDIRRLGSLWRRMPFTFWSAVIAAGSMAAIPPTFGFVSKEGMLQAFTQAPFNPTGVWALLIVAAVGALATFLYSARYVFGAFIDGDTDESHTTEAKASLWLPAAIPGVLSLPVVLVLSWANHPLDAMVAATGAGEAHTHLALWHGINLPLGISLLVITLGVIGILNRRRIFGWFESRPLGLLPGAEIIHMHTEVAIRIGKLVARPANSLTPNRHVLWIFLTLIGLGWFTLLGPDQLLGLAQLEARVPGIDRIGDLVGLVIIAFAVVSVVSTRSRLASVILVGIAGAGVSWVMLTLGAPDVALTNLLVEFCVVVIMMLVIRHQPRLYLREGENRAKFGTTLAVVVGLGTFFGVWLLLARHPRPEVAMWYLERTPEVSGANNVVAAILVEFRAFDTLGELSVLGMAGIVIAAVINSVPKSPRPGYGPGSTSELFRAEGSVRFPDVHKVPELAPFYSKSLRSTYLNSILPRMALVPVIPVLVVFSAVTFWRGHQAPGGGFLAALVAACALLLWYLSQARTRKVRADEFGYRLIAGGVALAFLTGIAGFFRGSFLAPLYAEVAGVHLTTSLLFDGGVYLAVLGLVVVIVNQMGGRDRPGNEALMESKAGTPTQHGDPAAILANDGAGAGAGVGVHAGAGAGIAAGTGAAAAAGADAGAGAGGAAATDTAAPLAHGPRTLTIGGQKFVLNATTPTPQDYERAAQRRAEREAAKRPPSQQHEMLRQQQLSEVHHRGGPEMLRDAAIPPTDAEYDMQIQQAAQQWADKHHLITKDETEEEFKRRRRRERRLTGHEAFDRELDEIRKMRGAPNPAPQEKRGVQHTDTSADGTDSTSNDATAPSPGQPSGAPPQSGREHSAPPKHTQEGEQQ